MGQSRVLIIEDEPVIAEQIALHMCNNHFDLAGIAYDAEAARELLSQTFPDVVLIDINLGAGEDGISVAQHINRSYHIPFLFISSYADNDTISRVKLVEPDGYIVKPFTERSLIASIEIAISNNTKRSNRLVPVLSFTKINKHLVSQVSEREFEVLELIYKGCTNQQIAEQFKISVNTVKKHINGAYLKLDVATRTLAVQRLLELMNG